MLKSITIKNIATYNDKGIEFQDLKKVNFIYGANGSGKTTISNFLYDIENEKFGNCSLQWENEQKTKILVYNKGFRERNFGNGKMDGVFTLGEATTEQIKEIEEKSENLKTLKTDGIKKRENLETQKDEKQNLENSFKETTWTKIYKKHEVVFKEAFKHSKEKFKAKLLSEFTNNNSDLVTIDKLKEKAKTIFGEAPQNITPINRINFDEIDEIIKIENNSIWKKIIIGKTNVDISGLIQKLNINDWINQGRSYLTQDETCPFCQQETITKDFKNQLENFFDEEYSENIKSLKELKKEYNLLAENLINELNFIEINQKGLKETKLNLDKYSTYLKTLISQNTTNREYLNNKIKEPSRAIELISLKEQLKLITELITNANSEIKKHNDIIANFNTEKRNLIELIWKFIIEEFNSNITEFNRKKDGLTLGITKLEEDIKIKREEYSTLDLEIKNLSKSVTGIQPTINEINRLLKSYGFLNFKIVPVTEEDKGFYQIQREDGTIADKTLSEGEITFITLIYFLQLAKGGVSEETVNEERILVIDDPVSSLDSNVLFVVSTLIKEVIKNIKSNTGNIEQLILLTHNVYFHKEVSFIDGRTKQCNKTHFWILRKNDTVSILQKFFKENPIQSSYELLWRELKSEDVKSNITIQNIMRRIIENYFKLLGKYGDDDLIKKFETKEEQEICRSLINWINDGSHNINDDLFIERQDQTAKNYKKVFKEIFLLTNQKGHYNMMMGINEELGVIKLNVGKR